MSSYHRPPRLLPPGVRDLFGAPARRLATHAETLRRLLDGWGYDEVVPPAFEYLDNVLRAFDERFAGEIYRVVDPDGQLLALRPDLTVPVARLVATTLFDQPLPQRLFYVAPVFRFSSRGGRQSRQRWQAGWELIGPSTAAADAEVIALVARAVERLSLDEFQINLGHMGFVRAVLADAGIDAPRRADVLRAIDRKNGGVLERELAAAGTNGAARRALAALPDLYGGLEVLDRARELAPNDASRAAIARLDEVMRHLRAHRVDPRVTLDLGEVRGMDYYTGITFELFARGSAFAIASGGRYDDLLARFGHDLPAVGAMIELEPLDGLLDPDEPAAPAALLEGCTHRRCLDRLTERRARGERVELDVSGRSRDALEEEARRRGIPEVLSCLEEEGG